MVCSMNSSIGKLRQFRRSSHCCAATQTKNPTAQVASHPKKSRTLSSQPNEIARTKRPPKHFILNRNEIEIPGSFGQASQQRCSVSRWSFGKIHRPQSHKPNRPHPDQQATTRSLHNRSPTTLKTNNCLTRPRPIAQTMQLPRWVTLDWVTLDKKASIQRWKPRRSQAFQTRPRSTPKLPRFPSPRETIRHCKINRRRRARLRIFQITVSEPNRIVTSLL